MLNLNDCLYLSSGDNRDVYFHPNEINRCVKIDKSELKSNTTEEMAFKKYSGCKSLPNFYGVEDTNLGKGLVVELVVDYDGVISKSIEYYLQNGEIDVSEGLIFMSVLSDDLIKHKILLHDTHLHNILLRKNADMSFTPIMIDGFGPKLINAKNVIRVKFPLLAKRKNRSLWKVMLKKVSDFPILTINN